MDLVTLSLFDNINTGIIILNNDDSLYFINDYMKNFIKTNNLKDKYNSFDDYINVIDPAFKEEEKKKCKMLLRDKIHTESVCKIKSDKDEKGIWVKINRYYNESMDKFIITFDDINYFKNLELECQQSKKINDKEYDQKSSFLASMSHEIRTPINGIIGMITLLEDTQLNNEQSDYINMLRECSINLLSIINDILDFSKLEAGKINLDLKCVNLRKCIESVNDILATKLYEKKDEVEYNYLIDSNLPENIMLDSNRLKQVLLNLLTNAIKFTDKGSILLNIKKINNNIEFSIHDTGCGINDKDKEKLFKAFTQLDNKTTTINNGTGLGLIISKELVKLMSGNIYLEASQVNIGSTFKFYIEIKSCESESDNIDLNEMDYSKLIGKRVLILDDNRENRISLTNTINKWGMIPIPFGSAIEALHMTKINPNNYDIGLIDACMPEMSGLDFAIKFRKYNNIMPLIVLSSMGEINNDYKTYFNGHLLKPYKEFKLKQLCLENLEKLKIEILKPVYIELNKELKNDISILIVEDVIINQKVVIKFLNKLNFNCIDVVDDGKKCLEMMSKKKYDIVLLDIKMPILDGELVCKYILDFYQLKYIEREKKEFILKGNKQPYIAAVTAYSLKEDRERYLNMGFNDYVPKPINIKQLELCMKNFTENLLNN
jgi:CheY-like chemotaxis protein